MLLVGGNGKKKWSTPTVGNLVAFVNYMTGATGFGE
jgi:hypothetical protein